MSYTTQIMIFNHLLAVSRDQGNFSDALQFCDGVADVAVSEYILRPDGNIKTITGDFGQFPVRVFRGDGAGGDQTEPLRQIGRNIDQSTISGLSCFCSYFNILVIPPDVLWCESGEFLGADPGKTADHGISQKFRSGLTDRFQKGANLRDGEDLNIPLCLENRERACGDFPGGKEFLFLCPPTKGDDRGAFIIMCALRELKSVEPMGDFLRGDLVEFSIIKLLDKTFYARGGAFHIIFAIGFGDSSQVFGGDLLEGGGVGVPLCAGEDGFLQRFSFGDFVKFNQFVDGSVHGEVQSGSFDCLTAGDKFCNFGLREVFWQGTVIEVGQNMLGDRECLIEIAFLLALGDTCDLVFDPEMMVNSVSEFTDGDGMCAFGEFQWEFSHRGCKIAIVSQKRQENVPNDVPKKSVKSRKYIENKWVMWCSGGDLKACVDLFGDSPPLAKVDQQRICLVSVKNRLYQKSARKARKTSIWDHFHSPLSGGVRI